MKSLWMSQRRAARVHGTLQPTMRSPETRTQSGARSFDRSLWAALVPLLLLLRPYEGVIQDARIYIGRGLADRDPLVIGQDILFTTDGQTGFTELRPVIRGLLDVLSAAQVSMTLALVGSLLWLAAVVALVRGLARDRIAWAAAVCVLALPSDYGSFQTFVYGEAVATPRVFAEAAVIAALAALLRARRLLAIGLLIVALAFHPLMALPGLAIMAVMLVGEDRRWLLPIGLGLAGLIAAAALKLPLADRLFAPMDATWLEILRERSVNLFPSLWQDETFARISARLAALAVAATVSPPRARGLLLAVAVVALGGLGLTALFGDRMPLILVAQLQTWRALWPLALLGNAGVALAAAGLWHRGPGARLTLAVLAFTFVSISLPPLAIGLAALTLVLRLADAGGRLARVSPLVASVAVAAATIAIGADMAASAGALVAFLAAARAAKGEAIYAMMLVPGVQAWPLVIGAIVVALRPAMTLPSARIARIGAIAVVGFAGLVGVRLWDSRTAEYRTVDAGGAASAELRRLLGPAPGAVLWIDEYNESWFFTGRPSFFNKMQGGPILFSRALAVEWHARGDELVRLGLARRTDVSPWAPDPPATEDLPLSAGALNTYCAGSRHPAAIVAPGAQLAAVPAGWQAGLWHPPVAFETIAGNHAGLHWRKVDTFTVIRCPATDAAAPPS